MQTISDAKKYICKNEEVIKKALTQVVKDNNFNYRTFGTEIEDYVTDILVRLFTEGGFIHEDKDYRVARHKNEFPDFLLLSTKPALALEIKSGNHSKISNGKWVKCKNSNNDMGTLNAWEDKLEKYGGDNIYYLFIEYNFNDKVKELKKVTIAPFYQFIGINTAGFLKYREKDGNLRPKDFDAEPPIKTFKEFKKLFKGTAIYRSKRIIKKHYKELPDNDRDSLIKELED